MLMSFSCRLARHIMRISFLTRRGTQHSMEDSTDNTDEENRWDSTITHSLQNILGKCYKPKTRHRFVPPLPKLKFNQDQMIVYSSLNFKELKTVEEPKTPAVLYKSSSTLLPRIAKVGGHRTPSDSRHAAYYNASTKQHRVNHIAAAKSASRRQHDGLMRSTLKK